MTRSRLAILLPVLALACACTTRPVFPVGMGDRIRVAVDAHFSPVYTSGTWALDGFKESLAIDLAKYNIEIVDRHDAPDMVVLVELGKWAYLQVIYVEALRHDRWIRAGRVQVPELSMTTLYAAAEPVAALIASEAARRNAPDSPAAER